MIIEIVIGLVVLIIVYVVFALIGHLISKKVKIENDVWYHHLNAGITFILFGFLALILYIAWIIGKLILN